MRGYAVASVLRWRAFGFINLKQLKARHLSTNPFYPYRFFTIQDLGFAIYDPDW
jgi:hypothetical protein